MEIIAIMITKIKSFLLKERLFTGLKSVIEPLNAVIFNLCKRTEILFPAKKKFWFISSRKTQFSPGITKTNVNLLASFHRRQSVTSHTLSDCSLRTLSTILHTKMDRLLLHVCACESQPVPAHQNSCPSTNNRLYVGQACWNFQKHMQIPWNMVQVNTKLH